MQFVESAFSLRTSANYDHHCSFLHGLCASADSTTYGVCQTSTLNKIQHFHIANGQLPQDVMHIFEGVLPYETKLLLFTLIYEKKLFTLKDLNDRIASFVCGMSEARNKPPKAFEEAHIKGPKKKLPLSGMCTHDSRYFNK